MTPTFPDGPQIAEFPATGHLAIEDPPPSNPVRLASGMHRLALRNVRGIDTSPCVQHPEYIVSFTRRLAALAAVLALSAGNVAVCAGWQSTAEARMACCMSDTTCPMHRSEGHDHSATSGVSQTQADSCCAASAERRESSSAASTFVAAGATALVPARVSPVPTTMGAAHEWRALIPLPVSSVAKYLRLSVLLV
jgi:hypothetical protein